MTLAELLATARTCRRFRGSLALAPEILADLVNMTRFCPSARNLQILRYVTVSSSEAREKLFGLLTLGGSLKAEQRATEAQHPGGYIVILGPEAPGNFGCMDVGIAAQTINLAANAAGLACCMVGAFNKTALAAMLPALPDDAGLTPLLVLALGAPDEERHICPLPPDGSTAYFRDDHDAHWVPKRELDHILLAKL